VEERVEGRKPAEVGDLPKRSRALVSRRIARFVLEPAFERGVFYADPHPGNFLIKENGSLSVIDFGKVGRLTPDTRRRVAEIFIAVVRSDGQRLADRLIEITAPTRPIDLDLITREINRMLALYVDVSLERIRFGDAMNELLQLIHRHSLRVPGTLVQFFKALAMCEGMLESIDPDSSFSDYLQPMLGKLVYEAFVGPQLLGRLRDSAVEAAELSIELPRRIDSVLGEIERGNLRVWTLHWPRHLPNTRQALAAAEWVRRNQPSSFSQFHKGLFEAHFALGEDLEDPGVIARHATESGIALAPLPAALADGTAEAAVTEAETIARKYGVQGTPAWLLAQRLITGLRPAAEFERLAEHVMQLP